ncbi:MAG: ABC transporter ATP-binding protein [Chloroflexales bacterium]|nr:ABC transporter ATP-binding protein [Chloroflexales bacterium]
MMLLDVRDLSVEFVTSEGAALRAVDGLSFSLGRGEALGIVGESGCGKTTAMLALLRLLPPAGRIAGGQVLFDGTDLLDLAPAELRRRRWGDLAIVFQGAMSALNPVRSVGDQIREAVAAHLPLSRPEAERRVGELLDMVGISASRAGQYPHQYSGGMRQRAMIAMALACGPQLLIADEPTTALDVMVQAQILDLLNHLREQLNLGLIIVTHDLGVVAETCQAVLVMYGGRLAEHGPSAEVFAAPRHPYTRSLLRAFPDLGRPGVAPEGIPGSPPRLSDLPPGCRFHPRCGLARERCLVEGPAARMVVPGHRVACHYPIDAPGPQALAADPALQERWGRPEGA